MTYPAGITSRTGNFHTISNLDSIARAPGVNSQGKVDIKSSVHSLTLMGSGAAYNLEYVPGNMRSTALGKSAEILKSNLSLPDEL